MDKALIQTILEAVENGNSRTLNSLLQCKENASTGPALCPSSDRAQYLLEVWRAQLNGDCEVSSPLLTVQGFQALLLIRPCYVTPWTAIVDFATKCRIMPFEEVYLCVSSVDVFLRESCRLIADPSGSACGFVEYVGRAAKEAINKLLDESSAKCQNDRALLLCDLLFSLFVFTKTHCSVETNEELLNLVYRRKLSPVTIEIWIRLVQRLISVVTVKEVDAARDSTLHFLKRHGAEISVGSLMNMMTMSMEISTMEVIGDDETPPRRSSSWYQVPIYILFVVKDRQDDYASLDLHLSTLLSGLTRNQSSDFWKTFDAEISGPEWVRANILSLICLGLQNSTSVSELLSRGLETHNSTEDLTLSSQARLLDILFPKNETTSQLGLTDDFEDDKSLLVEVLGDYTYGGLGAFVDPDDEKMISLSNAAELLLNIIWRGKPSELEPDLYLQRRSLEILKLAESFIFCGKPVLDARAMLFFVVSIVVMYCEAPSCREMVCNMIRKGLQGNGEDPVKKNACIAAVSLVVGARYDTNLDSQFLEPCISLLRQPLDAETFMHLAACISPCEWARTVVMSSSKDLLNLSYSCSWEGSDGGATGHNAMVRAGLFGLLELVRSPSWDKIGVESWTALSDCIIMDTPPLKISDRTWLYEQITGLLQDEEMDESVARHFFRATIARLAKFVLKESRESSAGFVAENAFIVWEDLTDGITQTRQTEDLVGLLRLSLSLYFKNCSRSFELSPLIEQVKIHDLLIRRVLCDKRQMHSDDRYASFEELNVYFEDKATVESTLQFSTMVAYFAAVFDYLARMYTSHPDICNFSTPDDPCEILERGLSCVVEQERAALDSVPACVLEKWESTGPKWLATETEAWMSTREVDVEPSSMVLVHSSLCEFLIEVLCGQTLRSVRGRGRPVQLCRQLVRAVGCVLDLKQTIEKQEVGIDANDHRGSLNAVTLASAAAEYFYAASRVVQDITLQNLALEEAEIYLTSIILFCQAVDASLDNIEAVVWPGLLQSLWALYQVVGSEKGASRFVVYLEKNVSADADAPKTDSSVCSLKSIRSADDVDDSIRSIRVAILKALERCLQFASASRMEAFEIRSVSSAVSIESDALSEAMDAERTFIASMLRAMVQDLKEGLEGQSGGITAEIYESYLVSIQTCAALIYQFSTSIDGVVTTGIFSIFAEVVKSIGEILRSFPLPDATLFRSSLITAAAEFPCVMRDMLRGHIMTQPMDSLEMNMLTNPESSLVSGLFDDCIFILTRWGSLRDPNSVPWEDIASKLQSEGIQDSRQNFSNGMSSLYGTGEGGKMDGGMSKHPNDKTANHIEVNMRTKEHWSWALSCTFLALEEKWRESFRSIVYDMQRPERFIDTVAYDTMLNFLSWRQMDLRLSLERVSKLFTSSTGIVESNVQPVVLDMLAMNLPSAPRLRFCQLIAAVSKVLKLSIDQLCSCLKADSARTGKIHAKICFVESLSTVSAWLGLNDNKADFTVGIFRWLSILRRKRPPGEHSIKRIDTTDLVPWVEKASLQVRDLHTSLRNFERVVSGSIDTDEFGSSFSVFFLGGLTEMLCLTKRKLNLLELVMPSEYTAPSLPDFPTLNEANPEIKKRIRRYSSRKPKKRAATHIAKSRNRIVNAFMSLDRKNDGQDGAPSDAFLDLEDFLVEG